MANETPRWVYGSKSSFAAGELTPTIEGRPDLPLYQNGAKKIINWMNLPSGGLTRRPGTEFIWGKRAKQSSEPDALLPDAPMPTAQDLASRLFRLRKKLDERAAFFDYATLEQEPGSKGKEPEQQGGASSSSRPVPSPDSCASLGRQRRMIHLPYSRELSLLLAFERAPLGQLLVYVFYNGETPVETLSYKPGRPFCLKTMTYSTYQGVLYICLGLRHPLYRFKVDEDALAKFNDRVQQIYDQKQQETEAQKGLMKGLGEPVLGMRQQDCYQQVVEQAKLENPAILKTLFSFEVLEWAVTTYTPQYLTELLQVDMEKVNETLQKASEEEEGKQPLLLRTQAVAPFANRLWCFGSPTNSHQITASAKGDFADFNVAYPSLVQARNPLSPLIGTFVSETFDPVLWAVPFGEELLVGTTDGIYVLKEGMRDKGEFVKIHKELNMGVSPIKPVVLDKALFFVEGNRKNISCLTWSRERGGYQVHSLTDYADHLFTSGVVRLEGVRTPFNMLFVLLGDGHFIIFTHDADLKILGWTQHYLGGDARIIDMCALTTLKDDKVFFWCVRDNVEYLEALDTAKISSCPTMVREATYLDCASKVQDGVEGTISKAVQSLIDSNEFFEELDRIPQGYGLLSRQLHHQIDREAQEFDPKDFIIDGIPWENLASGVFVEGRMEDGSFIPDDPVDPSIAARLGSAPFLRGNFVDGLFMENVPLEGDPLDPQFLCGKLVGADPLKWEARNFLKRYFQTERKTILTNVGQWGAFLQGVQELIRFPQNMSPQNFNFYTVSRQVENLRQILEAIRKAEPFIPDPVGFTVTHKTKPHIQFHSRFSSLTLKDGIIDEFHRMLDLFVAVFKPFLDNIGLRRDFATIQLFVTHINTCFLEFMAEFEKRRGDVFGQISFLQDSSVNSKNFWQNAFRFDLTSRKILATKEIVQWLKGVAEQGDYKGVPFKDLDTERKALLLKAELLRLLEAKEEHIKVRAQTQFAPRNMDVRFMDTTQLILDVCASLGLATKDLNLAVAADALAYAVQGGDLTPTIHRRRGRPAQVKGHSSSESEGDSSSDDESLSFASDSEDDLQDDAALDPSSGSDPDERLNEAIEGGKPEPVWEDGNGMQQDYEQLTLRLHTLMSTVKSYIHHHYLLLSGQGNAQGGVNFWDETNTFRLFKYCFLDVTNMALYQDLFTNISLDTYTDLVQADSGGQTVFTVPFLKLFSPDKLTLVAGDGVYGFPFTVSGDQIKLTQPMKAFSVGFGYASVLKLFPLSFSEEADPLPKRNVGLSLKVYNAKDGWVEERQEDDSIIRHSLRANAVLLPNHFNRHLSDRGYLVQEVTAILATPYQSGWLDIPMKEGIKRDVCVTLVVDTPAPFTLLKVNTKAELVERYHV